MENEKLEVEQLLRQHQNLVNVRSGYVSLWNDVAKYVLVEPSDFGSTQYQEGRRPPTDVVESTALLANARLASSLFGDLTPSYQRWFNMESDNKDTKTNLDIKAFLDFAEDRIYETLSNSSFYGQVKELYTQLVAQGTAVMYSEEDAETGVRYKTIDLRECYMAHNHKGTIDTLHREFLWTAKQIHDAFPEVCEADESLMADLKKNEQMKRSVVHIVRPRAKYDKSKRDKKNKPFESYYILKDKKLLLYEGGYEEFPYQVVRWRVAPNQTYGTSEAMTIMPNIKMVNHIAKHTAISLEKAIEPPLLASFKGLMSPKINMKSGGINWMASPFQNNADPIRPVNLGVRPEMGVDALNAYRQDIQKAFFMDLIQEDKAVEMSATESTIRDQIRRKAMAPEHGRVLFEFLQPILKRTANILWRSGKLPAPPEGFTGVEWRFKSPLLKAQQVDKAMTYQAYGQQLSQWQAIAPEIMDHLNTDGIADDLAFAFDVPAKGINSPEQVQAIRQQRQQMQQAQQQAEMAKTGAEAYKTAAEGDATRQQSAQQQEAQAA